MNDDGESGIKEEMKCKREEESEVLRGARERREGEGVKAVYFKQIRFGEIGLSLQDSRDLHLSITGMERQEQSPAIYNQAHLCNKNTSLTHKIKPKFKFESATCSLFYL